MNLQCGFDCGPTNVEWMLLAVGALCGLGLARWRRWTVALTIPALLVLWTVMFADAWSAALAPILGLLVALMPLVGLRSRRSRTATRQ